MAECWERFKNHYLEPGKRYIVVYGEAGAGKTSFALSLIKYLRLPFLYINTEGSPVHERSLQVLGEWNNGFFVDAYDMWGLLYNLMKPVFNVKVIVIDSLNGLYRVEASRDMDVARQLFVLVNALLRYWSDAERIVIGTAQVTLSGDEPSGFDIISMYADNIIRMLRSEEYGVGEMLYENRIIGRYRISGEGIKWLECWI